MLWSLLPHRLPALAAPCYPHPQSKLLHHCMHANEYTKLKISKTQMSPTAKDSLQALVFNTTQINLMVSWQNPVLGFATPRKRDKGQFLGLSGPTVQQPIFSTHQCSWPNYSSLQCLQSWSEPDEMTSSKNQGGLAT
jgi:hypothetical protein